MKNKLLICFIFIGVICRYFFVIDVGEALLCRRIFKMRIINYINKNQYLIGVFAIVTSFILVRIPYFLYMPIPFINGDAFEYNRVINLLENDANVHIGFPAIGYPLFILFCEKIHNSTLFFFLVQSVFQLIAVLLFYHNYNVYLKKYLLYVAVLLIGYLTSNINLYFDTAYHPDSLMGSLFIISLALLLRLIFNPSYLYFTLLSFVVVYTISVRANGIVLIPLILIYLIYILISLKSLKVFLQYLGIFLIPILILSLYHFLSPIYNTFNIISYSSNSNVETIYTGSKIEYSDSEIWRKIEKLPLDKYLYTNYVIDKRSIFEDTSFAVYMVSQQRGYLLKQDSVKNIIIENYNDTRNIWSTLNLDTVVKVENSIERLKYEALKKYYTNKYNSQKVIIASSINSQHKWMHFIGFYKLFYLSIDMNDFILGNENLFFYGNSMKMRYGNCYNDLINYNDKTRLKRVYKELFRFNKLSNKHLMNIMMEDIWEMKVSRLYRYIIQPYYKFQPLLFRNFLFPIVFNIVLLFSIIGSFLTKFKSKIMVFSLICCLLLFITNYLFSFYFCYSYTRYTYQVSFIYYISVILLPFIVFFFKEKYINRNSN